VTTPRLYIFAISHYCEKARWALDYLGIDYELRHLPPGFHMSVTRRLGARGSSLPVLVAGDTVLQGSGKIIDWAEADAPADSKRLTPLDDREACLSIEKRLDRVAGVHVRRFYYSEALVLYPETVKPVFSRDLGLAHKLILAGSWGVVRKRMIELIDLGAEQGRESMRIIDAELGWLDELLRDGRRFLVGERFSRADLTAASLLAPLANPAEHPVYAGLSMPPQMAAVLSDWDGRPSMRWIREIYSRFR
jgi:glutathione S-transferase